MLDDRSVGLSSGREVLEVAGGADEATSVVYGMPRAAAARGAAERGLPLPRIGRAILDAVAAELSV